MEIRPILSALLRSKTGALLISAQVALTLAIVCNALYVVNQRLATSSRPSGVDEANTFVINMQTIRDVKPRTALGDMQKRDVETLLAIPGVEAAAWSNQAPMSSSGWGLSISAQPPEANASIGGAAYFSPDDLLGAFGARLVEGRTFEPGEIRDVDPDVDSVGGDVILITQQLGGRLFPDDKTYVGKTVYMDDAPLRVVGVIDQLMSPFAQTSENAYSSFVLPVRYMVGQAQYIVRTEPGQRARVMAEAEKQLTALRNDRVLLFVRGMDDVRDRRYRNEKAVAGMLVAVTACLLLVTGSGIVGMATLWVSQRRKQIGTRRALGATRNDILRYFVTENVLITAFGVAVGAVLTIALNLALTELIALERLPMAYLGVGIAMLFVLGVVAVLGPAWRAAAVPPAVATRTA